MCQYSDVQISNFKASAKRQVEQDILEAEENDDYGKLIEKYHLEVDEEPVRSLSSVKKILVIGRLNGKKENYYKVAKKTGMEEDMFEFVDYDDLKNFGLGKILNSNTFSDIICGPIPHRIKGKFHSFNPNPIREIQKYANGINVITTCTKQRGSYLHLSQSSFKEALYETTYYQKYRQKGEK